MADLSQAKTRNGVVGARSKYAAGAFGGKQTQVAPVGSGIHYLGPRKPYPVKMMRNR